MSARFQLKSTDVDVHTEDLTSNSDTQETRTGIRSKWGIHTTWKDVDWRKILGAKYKKDKVYKLKLVSYRSNVFSCQFGKPYFLDTNTDYQILNVFMSGTNFRLDRGISAPISRVLAFNNSITKPEEILHLKFNDPFNLARDSSPNLRTDYIAYNVAKTATDTCSFDSSDTPIPYKQSDIIDTTSILPIIGANSWSIAFWFRYDKPITNTDCIVSMHNTASIAGNGNLFAFWNPSDAISRILTAKNNVIQLNVNLQMTPYVVGTWYHFCLTTSATGHSIYLNGANGVQGYVTGNATIPILFNANLFVPSAMWVGGSPNIPDFNSAKWNFYGSLRDFRMYNRRITGAEVTSIYTTGATLNVTADVTEYQSVPATQSRESVPIRITQDVGDITIWHDTISSLDNDAFIRQQRDADLFDNSAGSANQPPFVAMFDIEEEDEEEDK